MNLRTINPGLSPNATASDIIYSLYILLAPWNWLSWGNGEDIAKLELRFRNDYEGTFALALGSGRESLQYLLECIRDEQRDEVIVQSFTCMVVVNAIKWSGFKPVFTDIDSKYNMDITDLKKKITNKTKAVIIQHTFGIPADIEEVKNVCRKHHVLLIEDCAHALGARYLDKKVGSFGDAAFFSLGRSKVISTVNGGVLITRNESIKKSLCSNLGLLKEIQTKRVVQDLMHPLISFFAKLFYFSKIGKGIMFIAQKLKLINMEVTKEEKEGMQPDNFVSKLSNSHARVANRQLDKLGEMNKRRKEIADMYDEKLLKGGSVATEDYKSSIYLRYPLLVGNKKQLIREARKQGIYLGDWYSAPVAPIDINSEASGYLEGSCPNCEMTTKKIINLPTYPSLSDNQVDRIITFINHYAEN